MEYHVQIDTSEPNFRKKLWECSTGEVIILDRQLTSPENIPNLFLIDQDSIAKREEWEKNPTGIFAFTNQIGRLSGCLSEPHAMVVALWNWWEVEEGYSHYFGGTGIFPETASGVYRIIKVGPFDPDLPGLNWRNYANIGDWHFKSHVWIDEEKRSKLSNLFKCSKNWWKPRPDILSTAHKLLVPYRDHILVAVHARLPWHFWDPKPNPEEYYTSIAIQANIIKKQHSNVVCYVGSDNMVCLSKVKEKLERKGIIVITADVPRTIQLDDWYVEGRSENKYTGALLDATVFSTCDYFIGGPSNVGYYALALNPGLKIKTPRLLRNVQCC